MIKGREFHPIIESVFGDVKGYMESSQIQINCPRCQERDNLSSPDGKYNLEINTAKQVFRCWKCDYPKFSGSIGKLVKTYGDASDFELYKSYAGSFTYDDGYVYDDDDFEIKVIDLPKEMILFSEMDVTNSKHIEAYSYMIMERKLKKEILYKFKLGFCIEGDFAGRIIIPSYDINGDINYFVARTYKGQKPPYLNPEVDKDKILFNEGLVNWDSTIYLVEGSFELLSFPVNVIPLLGKVLSTKLFNLLRERKPNIVIVLDPDAYINTIEIYQKIRAIYFGDEDKVKIVKLQGKEDLDEVRMNEGREGVVKRLYGARDLETDDYMILSKHNYKNEQGRKRFNSYKKYN